MSLTSGTRLGPYEVVSAIGAGGMGEVYKATDIRLNRTVAIKVLPSHFAANPEMKQRFEREAQTIAGLNHRHICTLHDVGEQEGVNFLVMECLEGETLASRISRGPLPVDEALRVALEMIDALDKAHRQGVVHRDLKPANVMLTKGGTKLLDFGLAKWAASGSDGSLSAMPTRADMTGQGMILGTLQYMAPEQVEGKEADARTDIFAFGAVLYEMLTGKRAFEGKSQASLIGAIMKGDPRPVSHVAQMTPPVLDHVVRRCLAKDPEERWQSAHDLAVQLAWIARGRTETTVPPAVAAAERKRNRIMLVVTAAALFGAVALAAPAYLYLSGPPQPEALRFRQTIIGLSAPDTSISPDGRWLAFVAKPDIATAPALFVRRVGDVNSVKLLGTENAAQPFWSPDNKFIAYVTGGRLKKILASGGAPQDITEVKGFSGGAWSPYAGGTILFGSANGVQRISAEGGAAAPITALGQGETGHLWPNFLPDGRHYTYLAWSENASSRGVFVDTLDGKERKLLITAESNAVYASSKGAALAAPGYIFFHRQGTLFAQPFNAKSLAFAGDPVQVASDMGTMANGRGLFDVSQTGALIYYQGSGGGGPVGRGRTSPTQFGFVDRTGGRVEIGVSLGQYGDMDLSPDGRLIAVTKQDTGVSTAAVWVVDWQKEKSFRLTSDPADNLDPVWSPNGKLIAFTSYRKGNADIYIKNSQNVGDETPLLETPMNESIEDWSKDGKYIAFECGQDEFQDICAAPIGPDGKAGKPFTVVQGHFQKNEPQFSYDGKWIAYAADINDGRFEVFVQSFPAGDIKQQVSTEGGGQPRWRRDGKELYYRTLDNRLMSVDIALGQTVEPGIPRQLFVSTSTSTTTMDPTRHMWTALPDGQRFLTRIGTGVRSGGAGVGSGTNVTPFFTLTGATGARRGAPGPVTNGLTVLLHWTSALPKAGQ